jgi:hypothetical protein
LASIGFSALGLTIVHGFAEAAGRSRPAEIAYLKYRPATLGAAPYQRLQIRMISTSRYSSVCVERVIEVLSPAVAS